MRAPADHPNAISDPLEETPGPGVYGAVPPPDSATVLESVALSTQYYASQQQAVNLQLRDALDDTAGSLIGVQDVLRGDVEVWQQRWAAARDEHTAALAALETELRLVDPLDDATEASVAQECGLVVKPEHLDRYLTGPVSPHSASSTASTVDPLQATIASLLAELHNTSTTLSRRAEIRRVLEGHVLEFFPDNSDGGLLAEAFKINNLELADPTMVIRSELKKTLAGLQDKQARLLKLDQERQVCLASENIVAAEQCAASLANSHSSLLAAVRERTEAVEAAKCEVTEFLEQCRDARGITALIERLRGDASNRAAAVEDDLERLGSWRERWQQEREASDAAHRTELSAHREALAGNRRAQEDAWATIQSQVAQLKRLGREQQDLASRRAAMHQKNLQREKTLRAEQIVTESLDHGLRRMRTTLARAHDFLSTIGQFTTECSDHIDRRDWSGRYGTLQAQEYVRAYDAFCGFYVFNRDRSARVDRRLVNTKRLLRSVVFQVDHAAEAMDDSLPQYRLQQQQLESTVRGLQSKIDALSEELAAQEDYWPVIEHVLEERGVDYEPPELRAQDHTRELLQAHVEAADKLALEEQRLLEGEKRSVRSIQTLCDATAQALQDRRNVRAGTDAQTSPV